MYKKRVLFVVAICVLVGTSLGLLVLRWPVDFFRSNQPTKGELIAQLKNKGKSPEQHVTKDHAQAIWNENVTRQLKPGVAFVSQCSTKRWQQLEAGQMPVSMRNLQPHVASPNTSLSEVLLALAQEGPGGNKEFSFEVKKSGELRTVAHPITAEWLRAHGYNADPFLQGTTLFPEKCIKTVRIANDDGGTTVIGSFTFEHPGLCRGEIEFSAKVLGSGAELQIDLRQFVFPVRRIVLTSGNLGNTWSAGKLQTAEEFFRGAHRGSAILMDSIAEKDGKIQYKTNDGKQWRVAYSRHAATYRYGSPEEVK